MSKSKDTSNLLTKESLLCGHHFPGNTVCLVEHPKDQGFTILDFTAGLTLHLREGMDLKEAYGSYEKYCCELPRRGVLPNIHEITLVEKEGDMMHKNIASYPFYKDRFIKSVREEFPIEGEAVTEGGKVKNQGAEKAKMEQGKGVLEVEAERQREDAIGVWPRLSANNSPFTMKELEAATALLVDAASAFKAKVPYHKHRQILGASVSYDEGITKTTLSIIVSYVCNGEVCLYTLDPSGNKRSAGASFYNLQTMLSNWMSPLLYRTDHAGKHKAMVGDSTSPGQVTNNMLKFWLNGRPTNEDALREWAKDLPHTIQTKILEALDYPRTAKIPKHKVGDVKGTTTSHPLGWNGKEWEPYHDERPHPHMSFDEVDEFLQGEVRQGQMNVNLPDPNEDLLIFVKDYLAKMERTNLYVESKRKEYEQPMKEKISPMDPAEMAAVEDYKKSREDLQRKLKQQVLSSEEMSILDKFKDEIAASQVEASVKLIQAEKVAVEQALKDSQLQLKKLRKGKANKTVLIQTMSVSAIATLIMYFILARVFHRPLPNLKLGSPAEGEPRRRKRRRPSTYEGASTNVPIALPPGREVFAEPLLEAQPVRKRARSK